MNDSISQLSIWADIGQENPAFSDCSCESNPLPKDNVGSTESNDIIKTVSAHVEKTEKFHRKGIPRDSNVGFYTGKSSEIPLRESETKIL